MEEIIKDNIQSAIDEVEAFLFSQPQVYCPVVNTFINGMYIRQTTLPAGATLTSKIHKTEHFNIIQKGKVTLHHEDGRHELLEAPITFVSKPGVQKVLYIHEDTVWSTVHLTENRDLDSLEAELIEPDNYPQFDRSVERQGILEAAEVQVLYIHDDIMWSGALEEIL